MHKVCSHRARDGRKRQSTLPGICRVHEQHFELLPKKKTNCNLVLGVSVVVVRLRKPICTVKLGKQPHSEWQEHQWVGPIFGLNADFVSAGERSLLEGKRTDLDDVVALVRDGATLRTVAEASPVMYIRFHRGIEKYMRLIEAPRSEVPTVSVFWESSGLVNFVNTSRSWRRSLHLASSLRGLVRRV